VVLEIELLPVENTRRRRRAWSDGPEGQTQAREANCRGLDQKGRGIRGSKAELGYPDLTASAAACFLPALLILNN
jgi:hypothetical protein